MEIKTKYNIGDEVFTMHDNEVVCITIGRIEIKVKDKISIEYVSSKNFRRYSYFSGKLEYMPLYIGENKVFPTKEELLKTL